MLGLNRLFAYDTSIDMSKSPLMPYLSNFNSSPPNPNTIKRFTYISKSDTCKKFAIKCSLSILDSNKATGPDKISNKIIISIKNEIAKPLCLLFNKSNKSIYLRHLPFLYPHKTSSNYVGGLE
jgi:hypothetical protein